MIRAHQSLITRTFGLRALSWALGWGLSGAAFGEPVVEKIDRTEVNWGKMTVRYYGEAAPAKGTFDFKKAENVARQDGSTYLDKALPTLQDIDPSAETAKTVTSAKQRSVNTVYYPSGKVRVEMETALPDVLQHPAISFAQKSMAAVPKDARTGVIVRLGSPMKPKSVFKIVDENHETLYDSTNVAQEAFEKHFMGRFVRRPGKKELAEIAGTNAETVDGTVQGDGATIQVSKAAWTEAVGTSTEALQNGAVAVVIP